jgi:Carboxypeptidase regulatory-like domain
MGFDRNLSHRLRFVACAALTAFSLLFMPSAFGQVDEGSVTGVVQDASGAVVPNAKVTLLNVDQGLSTVSTSDSSGSYTFSPVKLGNYSVSASAPGFSVTTQQNVTVAVSQNVRVNIELKPGAETQTVEVTTAPPQLQTEDASVGQVVDGRSVNNLPLNGRNFTFLAQLAAGVNSSQADTRGNAASGAFTANGLRPSQNNYLLDGIDNNSDNVDFLNGTNFVVLPPPDAIAEFKVQTSDFSAELGRAAGAVLNATVKSGSNSFHGAVWEFFRNDKLDAADWFESNNGIPKGELRWNQFGASIGGPVIKNKIFFFGDYQGFRHVQGNTLSGINVPTALQRSSGYTDLSEIVGANASSAPRTDAIGRSIPVGTVLDPATTRAVAANSVDPVSGFSNNTAGVVYVRDPFGTCPASTQNFTQAGCGLNQLPAGRIDPNAVKLLNLYPNPTTSGVAGNFASSPNLYQHNNQFDVRTDFNASDKNQVFARASYWDNPEFIPGPFGGIADGGGFQQGNQTAKSFQGVGVFTHLFTPTTVNVARFGWSHLHTSRSGPEGNTLGIPAQFNIAGIPQVPGNGGLPAIGFGGLQTLGANNFLPSDETTQTTQVVDDFSKIYGAHGFKMGVEYQHVVFNTLQPAWGHGQFDYNGSFTDIPSNNGSTTGIAQFLLPPTPATVPNGVDYSGGSDDARASNINKTYDERIYLAGYVQDDWKVNPNLTLNIGLRYDYFGPINEKNGAQANFVPQGVNGDGTPTFIIPASGKGDRSLSTSFTDQLAKDGITLLQTNKYGQGLLKPQYNNFAPRFGFAYQVSPRLVTRGGIGYFYNAFENQGYGPNIGENYPFVYNFEYNPKVPDGSPAGLSSVAPTSYNTPYANCPTAGPGQTSSITSGFSCFQFTPTQVNAAGLGLQGLQFKFVTPRTTAANLSVQYAITHSMSAQVAYVLTQAAHLQMNLGANNVTALLPYNASSTGPVGGGVLGQEPFPDFGGGSTGRMIGASTYNGLQTKLEQALSNGLNYLLTYTYSKTLTDAGDLLNGGSLNGARAPDVKGFGVREDWSPASFDIRNVFHFSGGYELPVGKDKRFMANSGKVANATLGGWAINWIVTVQGGQPLSLSCPTATTVGTNCNDVTVPGQDPKLGIKIRPNASGKLTPYWLNNPAAFQQPCQLDVDYTPKLNSPAGCVPATGFAVLGNRPGTTFGPNYRRFDFSVFKNIPINERFSAQFRGEFFNIVNHPNFNAPNFGGNGVVAIANSANFNNSNFGAIGGTRDAPNAPRQIQFSLKLYY